MAFATKEATRTYMREYVRVRLRTDPEFKRKHTERAISYQKVVRDWLAAYKLASGCVDCGYRAHAAALQLDHEGPKTAHIVDCRTSIARLQAEITTGQCKVRCANCHAIKTVERKRARKLAAPSDKGAIGKGCD